MTKKIKEHIIFRVIPSWIQLFVSLVGVITFGFIIPSWQFKFAAFIARRTICRTSRHTSQT